MELVGHVAHIGDRGGAYRICCGDVMVKSTWKT